jgi:hypothetical protein
MHILQGRVSQYYQSPCVVGWSRDDQQLARGDWRRRAARVRVFTGN